MSPEEQKEAHYFFILADFASLIKEYGYERVRRDILKYQKIDLEDLEKQMGYFGHIEFEP